MDGNRGRELASKWLKTNDLLKNPAIAKHIPSTRLYSPSRLRQMVDQYGTVFIKPVRGTGGVGVAKIGKSGKGYSYAYRSGKRSSLPFGDLLRAVERIRGRKAYLIQQGIDLAEIEGRPVDYRVKYVKTENGWVFRAVVGRIARRGLFVTNICRGGKLVSGAEAIKRSLSPELAETKKKEMRELTKTATALLEQRFPGIRQLGYDYGIDRKGQIWLLEVNTRPH
ncbi:YheC/YheD family protein [Cohnella candidum]|uniref:YheC/YheD family protein n=1 Tax=Cohnella candidum TaxID=2674991 RepID=A0A3G3JT45_9BACL|nr:YheC/YheD family protein [Cohnella candidum]AYQ71372.1 YheC/YheD family protein [Cohnella candidum]